MKKQRLMRPEGRIVRILDRVSPPNGKLAPGILMGILADACVVGLLALSMWLIVRAAEQPSIVYLTFAIVGVRAIAIGRAAFRYLERVTGHSAVFEQLANFRVALFERLVPRVPGSLPKARRGDVLHSFVDDIDTLQDEPLRVRMPIAVSGVIVIVTLVCVAVVMPLLAIVLAVLFLIAGALSVLVNEQVVAKSEAALADARADLADALLERAQSDRILRAFDALSYSRSKIHSAESALDAIARRSALATGFTAAIIPLFGALGTTTAILMAKSSVAIAVLSPPAFATLMIIPLALAEVWIAAPTAFAARRRLLSSAVRISDIVHAPIPAEVPTEDSNELTEQDRFEDAARFDPGAPLLQLKDFTVRYPGKADPQFYGVTARLSAGETLLITGESGAGKSTLALGLARHLEYQGDYLLEGAQVRDLHVQTVRERVVLCEQRPHLFHNDLRQNLKFAQPDASDAELLAVLERVGLREWAQSRDGLDTWLGEHGALVSGGQAQRIGLARALLAAPELIILDEPTASVDRALADSLMTDLMCAAEGRHGLIIISHTNLPTNERVRHVEIRAIADQR